VELQRIGPELFVTERVEAEDRLAIPGGAPPGFAPDVGAVPAITATTKTRSAITDGTSRGIAEGMLVLRLLERLQILHEVGRL
jgi:hypothetical protein